MSGRSQHVTIPVEYRFRSSEVSIRRDPNTGELILSEGPGTWADVFAVSYTHLAGTTALSKRPLLAYRKSFSILTKQQGGADAVLFAVPGSFSTGFD